MSAYRVEISESKTRKSACAFLRDGVLVVEIPARWPKAFKQETTEKLIRRVLQKEAKQFALIQRTALETHKITLQTQAELTAYVEQVNRETFNAPLGPVKIGTAKYSRLAQVNLKTRVMTVSKYCLTDVPEPALRYLIVHELAHFLETGHNKRFWGLVAQFVPDYKAQSKLIQAFHRQTVQDSLAVRQTPKSPQPVNPRLEKPLSLPSKPVEKTTGRLGEALRQLLLFE